ncbi:MAG: fumarate hydratase [Candidatus Edwardsbacteria bacterium]|nr:fumarate hydratase [Candidatus Edwardsbacteria bacterium]
MRAIEHNAIATAVEKMCREANCVLPRDTEQALGKALKLERSPLGRDILNQCLLNAKIAKVQKMPICQDTGLAVFFVKQGKDVEIKGGPIHEAINKGVAKACRQGFLRASCVGDPVFLRKNTGSNVPAIMHIERVPGSRLEINYMPKGGGAENTSRLAMLKPSDGQQGVVTFVSETVIQVGANPCPPTVVGVGIGGNFERCALLAKKALMWPVGKPNPDKRYDQLEKKILKAINASGLGPQGLGGTVSCLSVHIEHEPCHMSSLPVAVNINCHAHRHQTVAL